MGRHFARFRGVLDAVILCAILAPVGAALGASASLNSTDSFYHVTHNPGGPGGATFQLLNQSIQATSTPTNTYNSPISFEPGGNTFGPTINGTFSIPFGATVGSGGFALLECQVIWEKIVNGGAATSMRTPFVV